MVSPDGRVTTWAYDAMGRVAAMTTPLGGTFGLGHSREAKVALPRRLTPREG